MIPITPYETHILIVRMERKLRGERGSNSNDLGMKLYRGFRGPHGPGRKCTYADTLSWRAPLTAFKGSFSKIPVLRRLTAGYCGNLYVSLPYADNLELVNIYVYLFPIPPGRLYYMK